MHSDGPLAGRLALVTGASSGVGRAIALELARRGCEVCAVGRDVGRLAEAAAAARQFSPVTEFPLDLTTEVQFQPVLQRLEKQPGGLDILIHCAGVFHQDLLERSHIEDLDSQYAINVRSPYLLTQRLLPALTAARGHIVFMNSSVALSAKRAEIGQYAATKHALKAVADSLREEVNSKGIRVLSVYLGRTATPMQAAVCEREGKDYRPENLLQAGDVASLVVQVLMMSPSAEVTDITIRPARKS